MPHTNNKAARDRHANRGTKKPAFLMKKNSQGKKAKSSAHPTAKSSVLPPAAEDPSIPKNRQKETQLIRAFHAIEKQLASPALTDPEERKKLEEERERLGGLEGYQEASKHGGDKARGGETSKWLVKQIRDLKIGLEDEKKPEKVEPTILEDGTKVWPKRERRKLRLLDVGAIAGTAYADFPWIDTTSIDLNPQAPHVIKSNFFDFLPPSAPEEKYDVVALSLVMNYEGSLVNRGHMLLHSHAFLRPTGYLYLVLPLPCLTNSRYMTHARLESILTSTGYEKVKQHDSAKLTYWLVRRTPPAAEGEEPGKGDGQQWKREQVREGVQRNNFVIVVKPGEAVERPGQGGKTGAEDGADEDVEMGAAPVAQVEDAQAPPKKAGKNAKRKAARKGEAGAAAEPAPATAAPAVDGDVKMDAAEATAQEEQPKKLGKNAKRKAAQLAKAKAEAEQTAAATAVGEEQA
ncbi:hypothetical protein JCM10207_001662 [Rhodosporidiobolus poonsookiae]